MILSPHSVTVQHTDGTTYLTRHERLPMLRLALRSIRLAVGRGEDYCPTAAELGLTELQPVWESSSDELLALPQRRGGGSRRRLSALTSYLRGRFRTQQLARPQELTTTIYLCTDRPRDHLWEVSRHRSVSRRGTALRLRSCLARLRLDVVADG